MNNEVETQAALLLKTLKALNFPVMEVDPAKAQIGPAVVRYRVRLGVGARLASLRSHAEDISRELSATLPPIIDNIPGEPYVGFDLPRKDRQLVRIEPALESLEAKGVLSMPLAIGVSPAGVAETLDLVDLPHLLVAGATGSGKTVFLHSLVCSIATNAKPQADIFIVDPKATDFTIYADSPKLGNGRVIVEPSEAAALLQELVSTELPRRTDKLHKVKAANLREYIEQGYTDLRPIVVVVDEFADLLMVLPKKERASLEADITRLAQRSRSVGIHLILATQRPTVDIVTGQIKANLPVRVAFHLPQAVDSRVVIDQAGAEALLGKGDMLILHGDHLSRLQGYFLDTNTIRNVLGEAKETAVQPPLSKASEVLSKAALRLILAPTDLPTFSTPLVFEQKPAAALKPPPIDAELVETEGEGEGETEAEPESMVPVFDRTPSYSDPTWVHTMANIVSDIVYMLSMVVFFGVSLFKALFEKDSVEPEPPREDRRTTRKQSRRRPQAASRRHK